jgi:hypothetical protein
VAVQIERHLADLAEEDVLPWAGERAATVIAP